MFQLSMHLKQRFRVFLAALVDAFTSRLDLAAAELEDLLLRLGGLIAFVVAGALLACFTLLFLGLTVMLAVPENYRWLAALLFTLFFAGSTAGCVWYLRKSLREMPAPFASTRDVLRRDAAALRPVMEEAAAPEPAAPEAKPEPEMTEFSR
jgi:uncharacterized membrane protein YqjE